MIRPLLNRALFPVFICLLVFLLMWPVWLWGELMGNDYYSHGLLIPFVALFLAVRRGQLYGFPPRTQRATSHWWMNSTWSTIFAGCWFIFTVVVYLGFLQSKAYYLAAFAMMVCSVGMFGS